MVRIKREPNTDQTAYTEKPTILPKTSTNIFKFVLIEHYDVTYVVGTMNDSVCNRSQKQFQDLLKIILTTILQKYLRTKLHLYAKTNFLCD